MMLYVLALLQLLAGQALSWDHGDRPQHALPRLAHQESRRDVGDFMEAKINEYTDKVIANLVARLDKMGYDPMPVPDEVREFSTNDWVGIRWHGQLALQNGTLTGLSSMQRDGDATLTYNETKLDINVTMKFDDLHLLYEYDASMMNFGPHGTVNITVEGLLANTIVEVDLQTMQATVKDQHLIDAKKISFQTKGRFQPDYLMDIIANSVSHFARKKLLNLAEHRVREETVKAVNSIDFGQYFG